MGDVRICWYSTECFHFSTDLVSNVEQGSIIKLDMFVNKREATNLQDTPLYSLLHPLIEYALAPLAACER